MMQTPPHALRCLQPACTGTVVLVRQQWNQSAVAVDLDAYLGAEPLIGAFGVEVGETVLGDIESRHYECDTCGTEWPETDEDEAALVAGLRALVAAEQGTQEGR